jgi:two-component system alkaline phosphatase synthesis response regulator PhoP
MKRVLIIEDDKDIVELVRYNLANEGFQVNAAFDGSSGLNSLKKTPPDLLLLDLMLPKLSGLDICREVRKDDSLNRLPILMLTARGEEADRVVGLEMGADDYVTKPFSRQELLLRVQAVLRRSGPAHADLYRFGEIELDCDRGEVRRGGKLVDVTALEFRMLKMFCENRGRILSLEKIIEGIWGAGTFQTDRVVYTHINNLRGKIEPMPAQPRYIVSLRGLGYRFDG